MGDHHFITRKCYKEKIIISAWVWYLTMKAKTIQIKLKYNKNNNHYLRIISIQPMSSEYIVPLGVT